MSLQHDQKATAEQKAPAQPHMQAQQTHVAAQQAHAHAQTQTQRQAQAQAQQLQQLNAPQLQQTPTVTAALNENAHHNDAIQRTAPTPMSTPAPCHQATQRLSDNAAPLLHQHHCFQTHPTFHAKKSKTTKRTVKTPSGNAQIASSPSLSVQLRSPPSKSQEDMKPRRNTLTDLRDALHGCRPARTKAIGTVRPLRQSGTAAFEKTLINASIHFKL